MKTTTQFPVDTGTVVEVTCSESEALNKGSSAVTCVTGTEFSYTVEPSCSNPSNSNIETPISFASAWQHEFGAAITDIDSVSWIYHVIATAYLSAYCMLSHTETARQSQEAAVTISHDSITQISLECKGKLI
jgi:hypothetical protein